MSERPAFGTRFGESMSAARWESGSWEEPETIPVAPFEMHPAAHALHYGSACFEGLKAFRDDSGGTRIFRLDRHVERMRASAERLWLPVPDASMLRRMVIDTVAANAHLTPDPPGSLYIRPTLIGTAANIGAAGSPSSEAFLYILTSPVGDYFAGGLAPLRIAVETRFPRTTPQFGSVKSGANYAMALGVTMEARRAHDVAQVLFVPGGRVNETGASNILLIDEERILTPALDGSFLEGVTRASVLELATELGFKVEEVALSLDDLLEWSDHGEIALSGTAAVLAPVGTLVVDGTDVMVGGGDVGPTTLQLRSALMDVQSGRRAAPSEWITAVPRG